MLSIEYFALTTNRSGQLTASGLDINSTAHADRARNSGPLQRFFESGSALTGSCPAVIAGRRVEGDSIDVAEQPLEPEGQPAGNFFAIIYTGDQGPFKGDTPAGLIDVIPAGFQ